MSAPYELRPLDLSDAGLAPVTDLLRTVFPEAGHFTPEVLRWQYVHNPDVFTYGGLVVTPDRMPILTAPGAAVRTNYGYAPGDQFKFHTRSRCVRRWRPVPRPRVR